MSLEEEETNIKDLTKNQIDLYGKYYEKVMKKLNLKNENLRPTYERFLKTVPLKPVSKVSHKISNSFKKFMESFEYSILLLGCGDSGKSTLFKQFYYKDQNFNFREEALLSYKNIIFENILINLSKILEVCIEKNLFKKQKSYKYAKEILLIANDIVETFNMENLNQYFNNETYKLVEILNDPAIQDIINGNITNLHISDGSFQFLLYY